ncbi:hypothetical protein T440DRAFT_532798 [Plenodomus tracheiphilus IPT5]|uniref:Uncharacterized protein n=1 Tax=Plenodomus tracheiphilus IPT5 TaxID=1408161 RepID=A0A6A7B664_9PLEO|nr:hypothetical protein T440DRAFT_532798 [Plenodomus tracheiphilus IPT5]
MYEELILFRSFSALIVRMNAMYIPTYCAVIADLPTAHRRRRDEAKNIKKTYNSGDSPVVTHLTTNPPVHCLSTAERTGSSIFSVL